MNQITIPTLENAAGLLSVAELLSYHDEFFIRLAFLVLLGRAADPDGLNHYLGRLRNGIDKAQILAEIKFSPEGEGYATALAGLDAVLKPYAWLKSPILNKLTRIQKRLGGNDAILCHLRALDNQLLRQQDDFGYELRQVDERLAQQLAAQQAASTNLEGQLSSRLDALAQQLSEQQVALAQQLAAQQAASTNLEGQLSSRLDALAQQLSEQQVALAQQLAVQQSASTNLEGQLSSRLDALAQQLSEQQVALAQQLAAQQAASTNLEGQLSSRLDALAQQLSEPQMALVQQMTVQQAATANFEGWVSSRLEVLMQRMGEQQSTLGQLHSLNEVKLDELKEYRVAVRPWVGELPALAVAPKVSVVIVQYQHSVVTSRCIRSLFRYTDMYDVEIVVVDNGSSPEHVEALVQEFGSSIRMLQLGVNRYFGEGNNIGVEATRGEFVVLINNDVAVTQGWLSALLPHLHGNIGVVAPTFLYPDGRVQECGATINEQGRSIQKLQFGNQSELPLLPFECDYVSAALIVMRKRDYLAVGGFSPEYEPAYYEDVDLCFKLAARGLRTVCVPKVRVYHVGNATSSGFEFGMELPMLIDSAKNVLLSRWQPFLSSRNVDGLRSGARDSMHLPDSAATITMASPAALFYLPAVEFDANTRYALNIARAMATTHQLVFACPAATSRLRLLQIARHWGLGLANLQCVVWGDAVTDQVWDKCFVFGNTVFPPIAAPVAHSIYACAFPVDAHHPDITNQSLMDGYQYWCQSVWVKNNLCDAGWVAPERVTVLPEAVSQFAAQANKEHVIVSVAKFTLNGQQLLIIEAFKRLVASGGFDGWRLILVGTRSPQPDDLAYLSHCMAQAEGWAIEFVFDDAIDILRDVYARAAVYWHGAGLGVDVVSTPALADNAGVEALEAASAGCHVFIPNAGSVFEWLRGAPTGVYACASVDELVNLMLDVNQDLGWEVAAEHDAAWLQDRSLQKFTESVQNKLQLL
ncbi:MAG: glycosyltransferase [Sulfuriferula sp.]